MSAIRTTATASLWRSVEQNAKAVSRRACSTARGQAIQRCQSLALKHHVHAKPIQRSFSIQSALRREEPPNPSGIAPARAYSFEEIQELTSKPSSNRILIDVREPSELLQTGRIPTAKSVPISSGPDSFFMSAEDFESKFGFPRPGPNDEVIFYCKAGVRSRQAALLAGQAQPNFGGKLGNYSGSWLDWEKHGGKIEKEGEQGDQSTLTGVTGGGHGTPRP